MAFALRRPSTPGVVPRRGLAAAILISLFPLLAGACLPGELVSDDASEGSETGDESAQGSGEYLSVIDHGEWEELAAADDPLAAHRPAEVACNLGWYREGASIEVDMALCNYLALTQPSQVALTEGLGVRLGFYHFNLTAPEPAEAHLAVLVAGEIVYEQTIAIPGDAQVYELEFPAPISAPAGAPVVFHLHNHGQNTWVLQRIEAELPE